MSTITKDDTVKISRVTLLVRRGACETENKASASSENNLPVVYYYSAKLLNITVRVEGSPRSLKGLRLYNQISFRLWKVECSQSEIITRRQSLFSGTFFYQGVISPARRSCLSEKKSYF